MFAPIFGFISLNFLENFDEVFVNLLTGIVESGTGDSQAIESVVEALFAHKSLCDAPATFLSLIK